MTPTPEPDAELTTKGADIAALAGRAAADPTFLETLLDGISPAVQKEAVRSNASKALQLLSETRPDVLLPHWDYFVGLLGSGNGFAQYPAIHVMANLAPHDFEGRWELAFEAFYGLLECDSVMIAGHVAGVSGQVGRGKPALRQRIAERLLKARYGGLDPQRADLVRGYALDALGEFAGELPDLAPALAHARALAASSSPGTRKKAAAFLKRFGG